MQLNCSAVCRYTEEEDVYDDGTCINDEPAAKRPKPDFLSSDVGSSQKFLDHFCSVELPSEDCDQWQTLFSQFDQPDIIGCMIVELHAGEMLYLPASWFHEVKIYCFIFVLIIKICHLLTSFLPIPTVPTFIDACSVFCFQFLMAYFY